MKAWAAILAGAGVPLGLCGIVFATARLGGSDAVETAARLGLLSSAILGPLGAGLGILAARRKVSATPLKDAVQLAGVVPALVTLVAVMPLSHVQGSLAALVAAPFLFLPGPLAGYIAARLYALDLRPSGREHVGP
jgi:hypothetical protein